ncbi:uncharacterized protein LOC129576547 [Sitodiplosis mosellana]|uniref:uncharacterized protein LOC129576547 n=1 Tax=Sitodiplosis mosellana TaxID=263140 RepID=UPI0024448A01|nr:uncharacterized protein LOC129576547 [Sitodiplosis mosellana]
MASDLNNSSVSEGIAELYLNSDLANIKFEFNKDDNAEFVPAHKSILAIASPVFLTLTLEHIEEVALLADKYDAPESVNKCATFIVNQLQMDNIILGYQLAITLRHETLKDHCEKYIRLFTKDSFKSQTFLNCAQFVLKHILQMDDLQCDETDVFDACVAWARHNCKEKGLDENEMENLRKQLGDCFYLIRIPADKLTVKLHPNTDNEKYFAVSMANFKGLLNRDMSLPISENHRTLLSSKGICLFNNSLLKDGQYTYAIKIAAILLDS